MFVDEEVARIHTMHVYSNLTESEGFLGKLVISRAFGAKSVSFWNQGFPNNLNNIVYLIFDNISVGYIKLVLVFRIFASSNQSR